MKEIKALIIKDLTLEWRQRYALNGMLLYLVSTIFVAYMSFKLKIDAMEPITWNTLFWIILLFAAVNSVTKSFTQERSGRLLYYYTLASPHSIILSKIIYNTGLLLMLGWVGYGLYAVFMGHPVEDPALYFVSVGLGGLGFSATLTLVAGIASKADNTATLMAVLSFPIILPMLTLLIKLSKVAVDGLGWSAAQDEIITLLGIDLLVIALSYLLFPYLWKS